MWLNLLLFKLMVWVWIYQLERPFDLPVLLERGPPREPARALFSHAVHTAAARLQRGSQTTCFWLYIRHGLGALQYRKRTQ